MKVKKDFVLKLVADEYVVVPTGEKVVDFTAMISLNETAAFIWNVLQNDVEMDDIVVELIKEYEIAEDMAKKDTVNFVSKLKEADLLE